ncbi:MAG: phosphoribosylglycinamide formyltransferase 1 [Thermoleophilaceae bacterium]|nr:phosphoribosylglycinamide formyltransferase 1 [Thermoleophilaceae bacterium]
MSRAQAPGRDRCAATHFRIAVLISGEGSNLQALLDDMHGASPSSRGEPSIEVAAVASSRAEARGLERAEHAGVETAVFSLAEEPDRAKRDEALAAWLEEREVELVVLAGFMELLTPAFIRRFAGRIVNVHPALLPAFPGLGAIEQAVEHGVKVAGVTVHFVDEGVDSGPIVLQEAFELPYHRDIAATRQLFHEVEHRLLPRAVRLIAAGRVSLDPDNPRLVTVAPAERADG